MDTKVLDWGQPLEAVNRDGRVVDAVLRPTGFCGGNNPDAQGDWWVLLGESFYCCSEDGQDCAPGSDGWTIRNVAPATPTRTPLEQRISPELVERLVVVVREQVETHKDAINPGPSLIEARAILAELEPMDGDLLEAEKMTQAYFADDIPLREHILTAIKRGRALERGE